MFSLSVQGVAMSTYQSVNSCFPASPPNCHSSPSPFRALVSRRYSILRVALQLRSPCIQKFSQRSLPTCSLEISKLLKRSKTERHFLKLERHGAGEALTFPRCQCWPDLARPLQGAARAWKRTWVERHVPLEGARRKLRLGTGDGYVYYGVLKRRT